MSHIHDTLSNIILQLATLRPCALQCYFRDTMRCSPGLGNRTRLFMSLTPGLGPRGPEITE